MARQTAVIAGLEHDKLTEDQVNAALLSPTIFTNEWCYIRAKGGKQEHFKLWDFQWETMECFDDEQRTLVLKARQLGISWLADAYALWLCTANRGQTVIILSQGQRESQEEMRRIRFMHQRLPAELKRRTGDDVKDSHAPDTTIHLEFPDMDSRIISLPSTEHAGTSYTATLVIIHELAKIITAATLIPAITPTMADDGRLIVVSTAYGYSGAFYDYWQENGRRWHTGQIVGDQGEPGTFRPVFIPWNARPGRNKAWYNATKHALKKGTMQQEYPATPTEAFQGSIDAVFEAEFDRHYHVIEGQRHPQSRFDTVAGLDLGVNHAYAYLIEVQGMTAFIYKELHLVNDTVESLGYGTYEMIKAEGIDPMEVVCYPDPAGVARNLQTLKTDYDVLKECGLLVDEDSAKVAPSQRVNIIKQKFKVNQIWISEDCPDLIKAFEQAQWKFRRGPGGVKIREDTYEKDGTHEHPLDASGYAISRVWSPGAPAAADNSQSPAAAGGSFVGSYSGSEFGG